MTATEHTQLASAPELEASKQAPVEIPASSLPVPMPRRKRNLYQRFVEWAEAKISVLSTRNNFWHRVCSWVFLPLAYRSGIKIQKGSVGPFEAVLPFRRFNRNWYNAMAGAALLGNSEIAGGMYVFKFVGADYTVVCKHLQYKFMRPCVGPAAYQIEAQEDIEALAAAGGEFNVTVDMNIVQMVQAKDQRRRRVGKCTATFHVTPKEHWRMRKARAAERAEEKG